MDLAGKYKARSITYLTVWNIGSWRLKVYGIAFNKRLPRASLIAAAERLVTAKIAEWTESMGGYGVGFVGIHDGRDYDVAFLDWWVNENELRHEMFVAPKADAILLEPAAANAAKVCVWDLYLQSFERDAWFETAMTHGGLEAYLERRCRQNA